MLLISGLYQFANSNANLVRAQMPSTMPSMFPTTTPTTSPSNMDQAMILLTAIIIVAIALIAMLLYVLYSRNLRRRKQLTGYTHADRSIPPPTVEPQTPAAKEETKPFQAFLCYKKSSGKDYADHLKAGLEEVGIHTFEDCKDIPQTVTTEEGWARIRDKALSESKFFLLIMTPGFDLSSEVVKEIGMARKQPNKTFVFFRHRSMGRKIAVNLGDEVLDIGQLEQVSFESKEELLRLAINILLKG